MAIPANRVGPRTQAMDTTGGSAERLRRQGAGAFPAPGTSSPVSLAFRSGFVLLPLPRRRWSRFLVYRDGPADAPGRLYRPQRWVVGVASHARRLQPRSAAPATL